MRAMKEPTHILQVEVPLDLTEPHPKFDLVQDAMRTIMYTSRLAYESRICNEVTVTLKEVK